MDGEWLFIQMGGSIDKDYPKSKKGWAFEIVQPSAAYSILHSFRPQIPWLEKSHFTSICLKDSQEIDEIDLQNLIECIHNFLGSDQRTDPVRIVITHGTDTLIETAR